ncbi:hypothetical protein [Streptomyces lincolnensis]|uniref:hypothetical protein n=1 Tax=Streptomyces lincolnensis TaxID=1915 RepID=UPI001E521680|nr:hypothetical protein [Streptomyces lincolnensis]
MDADTLGVQEGRDIPMSHPAGHGDVPGHQGGQYREAQDPRLLLVAADAVVGSTHLFEQV